MSNERLKVGDKVYQEGTVEAVYFWGVVARLKSGDIFRMDNQNLVRLDALLKEGVGAGEAVSERIQSALGKIRAGLRSNHDGTSTIRNDTLSKALNEIDLAALAAQKGNSDGK